MSPDKNSPPERPSSSGGGGTTNLQLILLLNAGFAMAAFAGGLMVNSVAILTHAILSLGDAISLGFSRRIATPSEKETSKGASKRQISHPLLMMGALAASVGSCRESG
jgi:Co/Zn/Cd efflux system component